MIHNKKNIFEVSFPMSITDPDYYPCSNKSNNIVVNNNLTIVPSNVDTDKLPKIEVETKDLGNNNAKVVITGIPASNNNYKSYSDCNYIYGYQNCPYSSFETDNNVYFSLQTENGKNPNIKDFKMTKEIDSLTDSLINDHKNKQEILQNKIIKVFNNELSDKVDNTTLNYLTKEVSNELKSKDIPNEKTNMNDVSNVIYNIVSNVLNDAKEITNNIINSIISIKDTIIGEKDVANNKKINDKIDKITDKITDSIVKNSTIEGNTIKLKNSRDTFNDLYYYINDFTNDSNIQKELINLNNNNNNNCIKNVINDKVIEKFSQKITNHLPEHFGQNYSSYLLEPLDIKVVDEKNNEVKIQDKIEKELKDNIKISDAIAKSDIPVSVKVETTDDKKILKVETCDKCTVDKKEVVNKLSNEPDIKQVKVAEKDDKLIVEVKVDKDKDSKEIVNKITEKVIESKISSDNKNVNNDKKKDDNTMMIVLFLVIFLFLFRK